MNYDDYGEDMDHQEVAEIEAEAMDRLASDEDYIDDQQAAELRAGC